MQLISLPTRKQDVGDALSVLAQLKADIESGKVVAFVAAGVAPDDAAYAYASSTETVSRLRMLGSISNLQQAYMAGEF